MYMCTFHYFIYYLPAFVTAIFLGFIFGSCFWIFVLISFNAIINYLWNLHSWRGLALSLWSGSIDSKTLDYQKTNPAAAAAKSLQSCPTLCDPIDGSPRGSPVPGILQARTLEWVAISFSNAWQWKVKVKSLSRVPTPSDPMDCSLPGSSIHGIFQARVLE